MHPRCVESLGNVIAEVRQSPSQLKVTPEEIEQTIHVIRGQRMMLTSNLDQLFKGIDMASTINRPNGHRWIQFVDQTEKRQTIRLGKTNKKHAQEVCCKVEALIAAKTAGNSIDWETIIALCRFGGLRARPKSLD